MGGHDRRDRRPVRGRPVRRRRTRTRRRVPRGGRLVRLLHRRGARLRRRAGRGGGLGVGRRVLRGLRGREEPVRGQPVRVRDPDVDPRRPGRAPTARAHVRDPRGAGAARDLHRARRGAAGSVLGHVPPVRAAADLHRRPALPPPRPPAVGRAQPARDRGPAGVAVHRPLSREEAAGADRRQARVHAAGPGAGGDRGDRHRLRPRLDPGGVRRDRGGVHRLHGQRVRATGPARPLLPRVRTARAADLPVRRAVRRARVHRSQARAPLPARPRRLDSGDPDEACRWR